MATASSAAKWRLLLASGVLLLASAIFVSASVTSAIDSMRPLFHGQDGITTPPLHLRSFHQETVALHPYHPPLLHSTALVRAQEVWYSGRPPSDVPPDWVGRSVTITCWYFDTRQDALTYPKIPARVWGTTAFPGWEPSAGIGQAARWNGPKMLVFAQGRVLVRVDVNSKKLGRDYTERIAQAVEARL